MTLFFGKTPKKGDRVVFHAPGARIINQEQLGGEEIYRASDEIYYTGSDVSHGMIWKGEDKPAVVVQDDEDLFVKRIIKT